MSRLRVLDNAVLAQVLGPGWLSHDVISSLLSNFILQGYGPKQVILGPSGCL